MRLYMLRSSFLLLLIPLIFSCDRNPKIEGMIYIPAGESVIGSDEIDTERLAKEYGARKGEFFEDERPVRKINIKAFYLDKYEVSNSQYKSFVDSTNRKPPPLWKNKMFPEGKGDHPVGNLNWFDADGYCRWIGKRLPTETEWEKAARGPSGKIYPYGNEYDEEKVNIDTGETTKSGSYETDKSDYGVYDMGGNIVEWTSDWYKPYPGSDYENKDFGENNRILRGGSYMHGHYMMGKIFSRASFRHNVNPGAAGADSGVRCAKSIDG